MTRDATAVAREKAAVRARMLAARARVGQRDRDVAAAAVAQRLDAILGHGRVRTLLGYAAIGSELVLDTWLEDMMATRIGVFLPFVGASPPSGASHRRGGDTGAGRNDNVAHSGGEPVDHVGIARVRNLADDVEFGWRGVREPARATRRPARVDRLDAFVVPGLAFDHTGARIGYGGGHFDRLLAQAHPDATLIGVAYDFQVVTELPTEPHDVRLHHVITEQRVYSGVTA